MRQVILDTETTGLKPSDGHRIIEIGCVEMINRRLTGRTYHQYVCPNRAVDAGAVAVHGITEAFLADKPKFKEISTELMAFLEGAELIIHNAPFDVGFLNSELKHVRHSITDITQCCSVLDTLMLARKKHPGQPNNLDALCKRYKIDNSKREFHGALMDSHLLGQVYLAMTGGQRSLWGEEETPDVQHTQSKNAIQGSQQLVLEDRLLGLQSAFQSTSLKVITANETEQQAHQEHLEAIKKGSGGNCLWKEDDMISKKEKLNDVSL